MCWVEKTIHPVAETTAASRAASKCPRGDASRIQALPRRTSVTTDGTIVRALSAFERRRVPKTGQYSSPCSQWTAAASIKLERVGAATTAAARKAVILRRESKRLGASLQRRRSVAARNASRQLVTNKATTREGGRPACASTSRWAGKIAA